MEKTKKNRIKKVILAALAVATVACVTASMTVAYLTDSTEKITNLFTGSDNVTATLYEPTWDGSSETNSNGLTDEQQVADTDVLYGEEEAKKYILGDAINKNPKIANTCDTDEYVAIKLIYKIKLNANDNEYTEVTKEEFDKLVTIGGWNNDWAKQGNTDIYVYNKIVKGQNDDNSYNSTSDLFTTVTVSTNVIPGQSFALYDVTEGTTGKTIALNKDYSMPEFEIEIQGAVIDTADYNSAEATPAEAAAALVGLFN